MVHSVTPILGFNDTLSDAQPHWDLGRTTPAGVPIASPQLGTVVTGSDGHDYVFAKATGAVASAATAVVLTEPAMTFAAGAGAFTTVAANQAIGDFAWLKKTAI
jgi:hypothetical protein